MKSSYICARKRVFRSCIIFLQISTSNSSAVESNENGVIPSYQNPYTVSSPVKDDDYDGYQQRESGMKGSFYLEWTPNALPNPIKNPKKCRRPETNSSFQTYLCDPDYVLSRPSLSVINYKLQNISASSYGLPCSRLFRERQLGSGIDDNVFVDDRAHTMKHDSRKDGGGANGKNTKKESSAPHVVPRRTFYGQFKEYFTDLFFSFGEGNEGDWTWHKRKLPKSKVGEEHDTDFSIGYKNSMRRRTLMFSSKSPGDVPVEFAVAIIRKMDLQMMVHLNPYIQFEDRDEMLADVAQYFAEYLYRAWGLEAKDENCQKTYVLIFWSVEDRTFIILPGKQAMGVLPWWRIESVLFDIRTDNNIGYADAIELAVDRLWSLVQGGPPTTTERIHDFIAEYGLILGFTLFTFGYAAYGEYRDRRERFLRTEVYSRLSRKEVAEARKLQREFCCQECPICLETFVPSDGPAIGREDNEVDGGGGGGGGGIHKFVSSVLSPNVEKLACCIGKDSDSDDEEGILSQEDNKNNEYNNLVGADGEPLKLLRCGHTFCARCWKEWASRGDGDASICPLCRQNIGKRRSRLGRDTEEESDGTRSRRTTDEQGRNSSGLIGSQYESNETVGLIDQNAQYGTFLTEDTQN